MKDTIPGLLFTNFNQDVSCISVGTETGLRIYSISPFEEKVRRPEGGLRIVEMLYNTNMIALVGGGKDPKFSSNRVVIFPTCVLFINFCVKRCSLTIQQKKQCVK